MSGLIVPPWHAEERPPQPRDFLFGGATFAAQVEAPDESPSRGPDASDWWRKRPCSPRFLERHAEDWRLARELGLDAVSFSLSWERLVPGGRGRVRREALDAYVRVAEAAAQRGLRPFATLWHHDLPRAPLASWAVGDAPERFGDVAEQAGLRLGHLVSFVTLHEPSVLVAPGPRSPASVEGQRIVEVRQAARAHALAFQALRATCAAPVGLALELVTATPLGREAGDVAAARFAEAARCTAWLHLAAGRNGEIVGAPARHGAFSPQRARVLGSIDAGAPPCDFVVLRPGGALRAALGRHAELDVEVDRGAAPVEPWVQLVAAWGELAPRGEGPSVLVATRHEGAAGSPEEEPGPDGRVADVQRAAALEASLVDWRRALAAGVPLAGWFVGLLDGYELEQGFDVRTGVVHVDWSDGRRRVKASGERLRQLVEAWR